MEYVTGQGTRSIYKRFTIKQLLIARRRMTKEEKKALTELKRLAPFITKIFRNRKIAKMLKGLGYRVNWPEVRKLEKLNLEEEFKKIGWRVRMPIKAETLYTVPLHVGQNIEVP